MATNFKEIAPKVMQATPEHTNGVQCPESLPAKENPLDVLSPSKKQTLALMAEGLSNSAIAKQRIVFIETVEADINQIFKKLGLSGNTMFDPRAGCIALYQRHTLGFKNPVEDYFGDGELAPLSPREKEVVRLIGEGYSNPAVASRLCLSPKTVENYINTILSEKIPVDHERYDRRAVLVLMSKQSM